MNLKHASVRYHWTLFVGNTAKDFDTSIDVGGKIICDTQCLFSPRTIFIDRPIDETA